MSDCAEVKFLEQPQRVRRLSEVVREVGYGRFADFEDCVLGRAYRALTGESVIAGTVRNPQGLLVGLVSRAFGAPAEACATAENMCLHKCPPSEIAAWLESRGL